MTKHLLDLHRVDELKNFVADNLLSWCFEVAYWNPYNYQSRTWEPCIRKGNCHYRTSQIGYWVKGSTVGKVLEIHLLVTACCDNNGVSGVVT